MQEMKPCPFCGTPKVKLAKNARGVKERIQR